MEEIKRMIEEAKVYDTPHPKVPQMYLYDKEKLLSLLKEIHRKGYSDGILHHLDNPKIYSRMNKGWQQLRKAIDN